MSRDELLALAYIDHFTPTHRTYHFGLFPAQVEVNGKQVELGGMRMKDHCLSWPICGADGEDGALARYYYAFVLN